jgi:hypothetical protein
LASRQPISPTRRNGFGEDAETCERDARAPHTDPQRDSIFIPQSRDPADAPMWQALDFLAGS